ncbi:hypothetical protein M422DRAFT_263510 [Sphaerobolus stellatus SS14]|uniref:Uncharacterized protein n=1 Tax=Sphaerobolus stellatus (strain SS14) TaxID=990650 RepID=A0A0C9TVM8_SPHS4|nr:hypothetical protein M422DRAFT_263510 [Sphaerobolus stellatus SS14]
MWSLPSVLLGIKAVLAQERKRGGGGGEDLLLSFVYFVLGGQGGDCEGFDGKVGAEQRGREARRQAGPRGFRGVQTSWRVQERGKMRESGHKTGVVGFKGVVGGWAGPGQAWDPFGTQGFRGVRTSWRAQGRGKMRESGDKTGREG